MALTRVRPTKGGAHAGGSKRSEKDETTSSLYSIGRIEGRFSTPLIALSCNKMVLRRISHLLRSPDQHRKLEAMPEELEVAADNHHHEGDNGVPSEVWWNTVQMDTEDNDSSPPQPPANPSDIYIGDDKGTSNDCSGEETMPEFDDFATFSNDDNNPFRAIPSSSKASTTTTSTTTDVFGSPAGVTDFDAFVTQEELKNAERANVIGQLDEIQQPTLLVQSEEGDCGDRGDEATSTSGKANAMEEIKAELFPQLKYKVETLDDLTNQNDEKDGSLVDKIFSSFLQHPSAVDLANALTPVRSQRKRPTSEWTNAVDGNIPNDNNNDGLDPFEGNSLTLYIDHYGSANFHKLVKDLINNDGVRELHVFRSWKDNIGSKRSLQDIVALFGAIRSLTNLQVLKLANFQGRDLGAAGFGLRHHPSIMHLEIHFCQGAISRALLEALAAISALQVLVLEMNESFPFHVVLSSKSLSKLHILVNDYKVDSLHLMETARVLPGNRVLRTLSIEPPMSLRAFKFLAQSLQTNNALEHLKVALLPPGIGGMDGSSSKGGHNGSHYQVDDATAVAVHVADLLRTNGALKSLYNLNFSSLQVDKKGQSRVLQALSENHSLEEFVLFAEGPKFFAYKEQMLRRNKTSSKPTMSNLLGCPGLTFPIGSSSASSSTINNNCGLVQEDILGSTIQDYKVIGNILMAEGEKVAVSLGVVANAMFKIAFGE